MKTDFRAVILGGDASPDQVGILLGAVSPRVSLTRTALRTRNSGEEDPPKQTATAQAALQKVLPASAAAADEGNSQPCGVRRDVALPEEQPQDLIMLMTHETKPSGQPYDAQFLLWQFGRLPQEKLKRLFDDDQDAPTK